MRPFAFPSSRSPSRVTITNSSNSGELTRWHIDNLMAHVAAAALIVDNYEVDVFDLREDLRLETKT